MGFDFTCEYAIALLSSAALQEYVAACVETQQQQEKELGKLKAEKREVERVSTLSTGLSVSVAVLFQLLFWSFS